MRLAITPMLPSLGVPANVIVEQYAGCRRRCHVVGCRGFLVSPRSWKILLQSCQFCNAKLCSVVLVVLQPPRSRFVVSIGVVCVVADSS